MITTVYSHNYELFVNLNVTLPGPGNDSGTFTLNTNAVDYEARY